MARPPRRIGEIVATTTNTAPRLARFLGPNTGFRTGLQAGSACEFGF